MWTGCQWNVLPRRFGDDSSVHRTFQRWIRKGVLDALWAMLLSECQELGGVHWRWQAADGGSQRGRYEVVSRDLGCPRDRAATAHGAPGTAPGSGQGVRQSRRSPRGRGSSLSDAHPTPRRREGGPRATPAAPGAALVVEDANAAQRGLVRIETRDQARVRGGKLTDPATRRVCFMDPNRDYLCVRWETYAHVMPYGTPQPRLEGLDFEPAVIPDASTWFREVVEFGRLASGLWYPTKLRQMTTHRVPAGGEGGTPPIESNHDGLLRAGPRLPAGGIRSKPVPGMEAVMCTASHRPCSRTMGSGFFVLGDRNLLAPGYVFTEWKNLRIVGTVVSLCASIW